MLELELIVVLIGLRTETYLLYFHLYLLSLHFLLAFLLLVEELGIVDESTDRRISVRRYFNKVYSLLLCHFQCLLCRHH